jgi:hypothetical protein
MSPNRGQRFTTEKKTARFSTFKSTRKAKVTYFKVVGLGLNRSGCGFRAPAVPQRVMASTQPRSCGAPDGQRPAPERQNA